MSLLVAAKQIGNAIAIDPNVPLALTESAGSGVRWPLSLLLGEAPDFCCIGSHGAAQGAEAQSRQGNDGNDQLTSHLFNPLNGSGEMCGEPILQIRCLKRRCLISANQIRFEKSRAQPEMPATIAVQCDRHIKIEQAMLLQLFPGQPPGFFRFESLDDRISILIEEGNHLIQ